ncbi:MAG: general stress protein [Myxococcales bacterium]|nr:general stress protein [Myxococcales bacterium]
MNQQERFYNVLRSFSNAMFISNGENGLHARPMTVAEVDHEADAVWFVTSMNNTAVEELKRDPDVSVAFQGQLKFASLTGYAEVMIDPDRVEKLWSEAWRIWFPEGKESSDLVLLKVQALHGEYWDMSGVEGVGFLYKAVRAYLEGNEMSVGKDINGRLSFINGDTSAETTASA